jgi:uncharacterized membrane protein YgdD (TMEM256/DUF423 family)
MNKPIIASALLGASTVLLGAYGAHGLTEKFASFPRMNIAYNNAVDYQMYHTLVLLVLGLASYVPKIKLPEYLWLSFTASIMLFSFPIYFWALGGSEWFLKFTPWGGTGLFVSWLLLVRIAWINRVLK